MYKVSVLVPVYNGEQFVSIALQSLVDQTLGDDLQIVVVDDGSVDSSWEIISRFVSAYPNRVIAKRTENSGAASARNLALSMAAGEYIGFMDCDDYVDLSMFEKLYMAASEEDADIATCGYYRVDGFDIQRRDYVNRKCFGYSFYQAPSLLRRNVPYNVTKLFRKSFLNENALRFDDDLRVYEDMLLSYKSILLANKVVKVPETLYVYNFSREGSLTFAFSEGRFDLFKAFERLVDFYKKHDAFIHAEDELLWIFLLHMYVALDGRQIKALPKGYRPIDFFDKSVSFLNRVFPWWKKYDVFFKRTRRPRVLYTNRLYMAARLHRPMHFMKRERSKAIFKKQLSRSRPGMYYAESLNEPVQDNTILIDSQRGENLSGNMFYLLRELMENEAYRDFSIGLTYNKPRHRRDFSEMLEQYGLSSARISLLKYNSKRYAQYLARVKFILTDTSMPVYFIKRDDQVYLNTWHGTPLKTLGKDMENGFSKIANLTKNFSCADYLAFQSKYMTDCLERAYMFEADNEKIILEGYPRNEIFFNQEKARAIREQCGIPSDAQVLSYLPTWRGKTRTKDSNEHMLSLLHEIDKNLSDGQIMFAKLHPYDATAIPFGDFLHIRPFPSNVETYEFLNASDILISDYSSVIFDFGITKRKIILFAYDKDTYLSDRGLYIDIEQLPVSHAYTVEDLIREIGIGVEDSAAQSFVDVFCPNERSDCSRHILELVIKQGKQQQQDRKFDALFFVGNFQYPKTYPYTLELLGSHEVGAYRVALTFDSEMLQNQRFLKQVNESVIWLGNTYHFSATSRRERNLLSKMISCPESLSSSEHEINDMAKREMRRAYPNTKFDKMIALGNQDILSLFFIAYSDSESCLYIDDLEYYSSVPVWLLKRFDSIYVSDDKIEKYCISNHIKCRKVSNPSLSSLLG